MPSGRPAAADSALGDIFPFPEMCLFAEHRKGPPGLGEKAWPGAFPARNPHGVPLPALGFSIGSGGWLTGVATT